MRAQSRRDALGHRRWLLQDRHGLVGAVLGHLQVRAHKVDPAGLQPFGRPAGEIASRGGLELAEQIRELGVAPGVLREVGVDALAEVVLADPGDELAERGGALCVGDSVEVHAHGIQIHHVGGDRMRGRQLILAVGPRLAEIAEGRPRICVAGGIDVGVVCGPLSEGLVEPQVVPPLHGDQIAEPHVRHLVQDRVGTLLVRRIRHPGAEDHVLEEGHARGVLHRPRVELRHEELVVLHEGVGDTELLLEEGEALLGEQEDVVGVEELREGRTAEDPQGVAAVRTVVDVVHGVVGTGDEGCDVRRHAGCGREVPAGGAIAQAGLLGIGCIAHHDPVLRRADVQSEGGLEVRLLEAGVHPPRVGRFELGVEVDLVVDGIDEAVQALARAHESAAGAHDEDVFWLKPIETDATAIEDLIGHELVAVEVDRQHLRCDEVDPGRCACLA